MITTPQPADDPAPVRILDLSATQNTISSRSPDMDGMLKDILSKHAEVGIVCISGERDQDKCILTNYTLTLMSTLSDFTSQPVLVQEMDEYDTGVWLWPQVFVVPVASETSASSSCNSRIQQVPFLLIDVARDGEWCDDLCIHVIRDGIRSTDSFMDKMKEVLEDYDHLTTGNQAAFKHHQGKDRLVTVVRDWDMSRKRDYRTIESRFKSEELFAMPATYKSTAITCKFLMSLVCHIFGFPELVDEQDLTGLMSNRISQDVSFMSQEEPVVEKILQTSYISHMKDVICDPSATQQSLVIAHNKFSAQAVDDIRKIRGPAQVTLNRIQMLNKRIRESFDNLKEGHRTLKSMRRDVLISSLLLDYNRSLHKVIQDQQFVEDHVLQQMHDTEMRKVVVTLKKDAAGAIGESELQEKISHAYELIQVLNTKSRELVTARLGSVKDDQLQPVAEKLKDYLSNMRDMDMQAVNSHYCNVKAGALRSFDAALKNLSSSPAVTRKMKKEFESAMDEKKETLVNMRKQEIQNLWKLMDRMTRGYVFRMECEFRLLPHIKRDDAVAVSDRFMAMHLSKVRDEQSRSELQNSLSERFESLWIELQQKNEERRKRVEQLVEKLRTNHNTEIRNSMDKSGSKIVSIHDLDREQFNVRSKVMSNFSRNKDVRELGDQRDDVEKDLSDKIAHDYGQIQVAFKIKMEEKIEKLVESFCLSFSQRLENWRKRNPPNSPSDQRDAHMKLMQHFADNLLKHELIHPLQQQEKEFHQCQLETKMSSVIEEYERKFLDKERVRGRKRKVDDAPEDINLSDVPNDMVTASVDTPNDGVMKTVTRGVSRLFNLVTGWKSDEMTPKKKRSYAAVTAGCSSISVTPVPVTDSQLPPDPELVTNFVKSYAAQVSEFIENNPDANFLAKLRKQNEVLDEITKQLQSDGFPHQVIQSVEEGIADKWMILQYVVSTKSPCKRSKSTI